MALLFGGEGEIANSWGNKRCRAPLEEVSERTARSHVRLRLFPRFTGGHGNLRREERHQGAHEGHLQQAYLFLSLYSSPHSARHLSSAGDLASLRVDEVD